MWTRSITRMLARHTVRTALAPASRRRRTSPFFAQKEAWVWFPRSSRSHWPLTSMARRMELLVGGLIGGAALVLFGKLRRRRWQSAAASKLPVDPSQCSMCYSCSAITNGPSVGHSNDPFAFTKRENYIQWHDYFMSIAVLSSFRSKDPNRQVGACIVNPSTMRIVAMGYNGFPHGCNDDALPWARTAPTPLETKYPYVCHAEMNAILNKNCESLEAPPKHSHSQPHNHAYYFSQSLSQSRS